VFFLFVFSLSHSELFFTDSLKKTFHYSSNLILSLGVLYEEVEEATKVLNGGVG